MLGLYGAKDASIPQDTVETMRQALRAANATAEIVVYPKPIMPLTPTIAPAIMKSQPKTAGNGCSPGLLSMAVKRVIALSMKKEANASF